MSDTRTQRQRMLAGEPYDTRDAELLALAHHARAQMALLAGIPSTDTAGRRAIFERLLGSVGEGAWLESPFFCDYGAHVHIGAHTFINVNCVMLDAAEIRIGSHVLLGPGVQLVTVTHPLRAAERVVVPTAAQPDVAPYRTHAAPITIGDGAWLGAGTIVLPGVTIGAGTTIGAGSLVTKDVPANCLAYGQPCRVQREL